MGLSHPLGSLIDRIMARAEKDGALENLSGEGKPLENLRQPKDAVIDKLMKENRAVPAAVQLKRQVAESQARLKDMTDEAERKAEMKTLADLQTRLAVELDALRRYG